MKKFISLRSLADLPKQADPLLEKKRKDILKLRWRYKRAVASRSTAATPG